ncbi:THO complex subunit 1 transcription elongation factor-domain-containing protein [Naematelia encephala]|uniref:THO complex subunit 1 transcription elongation factor-domain-containing protein n=1 Tax=Naematelia encephala TaxID=71784 RepID=A0A1Y2BIV1_9TREE|nr:THO complex subunit 1 transcription elongation factor-domain-containing protein [Naematelia encephala]
MVSSLYISLKSDLDDLCKSLASEREHSSSSSSLPPDLVAIPSDQLRPRVEELWTSNFSSPGASGSRHAEVVRSALDLLGREVIVAPLANGEIQQPGALATNTERWQFHAILQDRLDVLLTLYELASTSVPDAPLLEPGAVFMPLIEELVELVSIDNWRDLWTYVETRSKRFAKNMPPSRGKSLNFLRIMNGFLRFLPRTPEDLALRGRIHQVSSSIIKLADKSAVNMRGDYNDLKTTWESQDKEDKQERGPKVEGDGDVTMEDEPSGPKELDFYSSLWSLQQYLAVPPALAGPPVPGPDGTTQTLFQQFRAESDFVLPKLFEQTQKEKNLAGKDTDPIGKKRKRSEEDFFHPRYLTAKRLLDHELSDPAFRRQILVQYCILFQFLLHLTPASASKQAFTGGMPKTFVLAGEDEVWVRFTVGSIKDELRKIGVDGVSFEDTVMSIIKKEQHYADWKNFACQETVFELPPLDAKEGVEAARKWKPRQRAPWAYPHKVGTRALSALWKDGFQSIDQLEFPKSLKSVEELEDDLDKLAKEEEKLKADDQTLDASQTELRTSLNWRAIRSAAQTDLRHFGAMAQKRSIQLVSKAKVPINKSLAAAGGAEEEKTDDDDVVALKRARRGFTGSASVEGKSEGKTETDDIEGKTELDEGEGGAGAATSMTEIEETAVKGDESEGVEAPTDDGEAAIDAGEAAADVAMGEGEAPDIGDGKDSPSTAVEETDPAGQ